MIDSFIAVDFETATYNRMACQVGIVVVRNGVITERISNFIQPPITILTMARYVNII